MITVVGTFRVTVLVRIPSSLEMPLPTPYRGHKWVVAATSVLCGPQPLLPRLRDPELSTWPKQGQSGSFSRESAIRANPGLLRVTHQSSVYEPQLFMHHFCHFCIYYTYSSVLKIFL